MVPASIGRAQLQESPEGLRVVIPAKWSWYVFIVEPLLIAIILVAPRMRLLLESTRTAAILGVLLLVTVVRRWFWNIGGREVVTLSLDALTVRYEIFHIGWHKTYRLSGISNFRFVPPINAYRVHENRTVAFDYEFMPRRFGTYLSAAEVGELISVFQGYLPANVGSRQMHIARPV